MGEIEKRLAFIEFRQQLLFSNTSLDRILFEYEVTKEQYEAIMDLMDSISTMIDNGDKVHHGTYEQRIYEIVPHRDGDYHFAELVAQTLHEQDRWNEVFEALYGGYPKFESYLSRNKR